MSENPTFVHDCDSCKFLGVYKYDAPMRSEGDEVFYELTTVDLYYHENEWQDSVIARYSDDGPDYSSLDMATVRRSVMTRKLKDQSTYSPALCEAFDRAMATKPEYVREMNSALTHFDGRKKETDEENAEDRANSASKNKELAKMFGATILDPFCAHHGLKFEMLRSEFDLNEFKITKGEKSWIVNFNVDSGAKQIKEWGFSRDEKNILDDIFTALRGYLVTDSPRNYQRLMDFVENVG